MSRKIPYIFLYVADLARARQFYEGTVGLPVAETDPWAVKYDCDSVILALNVLTAPPDNESLIVLAVTDFDERSQRLAAYGVPSPEVSAGGAESHTFADPDGHKLRIFAAKGSAAPLGQAASVTDVLLPAPDLSSSRAHYGEALGLAEIAARQTSLHSYDVGRFRLSIYQATGSGRDSVPPAASYVFHADDCERERAMLRSRGIEVGGLQRGEIGTTATFLDPAGRDFYLYQPSEEALSWPSGPVYKRIMG